MTRACRSSCPIAKRVAAENEGQTAARPMQRRPQGIHPRPEALHHAHESNTQCPRDCEAPLPLDVAEPAPLAQQALSVRAGVCACAGVRTDLLLARR